MCESEQTASMDPLDRRTYLALVAAGTVGLAGCSGEGGDREPAATPTNRGVVDETPGTTRTADRPTTSEETSTPEPEGESTAESEASPTAHLGERVTVGDLTVVVTGVRLVDDVVVGPDGEVVEAAAGRSYAVADVAVQHSGGGGVVEVDDALTVEVVDGTGEPSDVVPAAEPMARVVTAARLAPGEVVRGDLVYDVDRAAEKLVLAFGSATDDERVVVDPTAARPASATTRLVQEPASVVPFSQTVESAGVEVRLTSLEQGNNLGGFLQSEEGYEVVAVGVTVENHSGRDRTLRPTQTQLKDQTGRVYEVVPTVVGALNGLDDVDVRDGEDHEGEVVYRVEEGASALYWVFDFGEWGENRRLLWQLR
jgi:hypothetical protein